MSTSDLHAHTPVLVGVGQYSERRDQPGYLGLSAVDLAAAAARAALTDTEVDSTLVAEAIDTVAGVRQFEISLPFATAPLGRSTNFPRSVADRIGANPRQAVLEVSGGQAPQHLVTEFARKIAAGDCNAVLLVGGEAISTSRRPPDPTPDFTEHRDGQLIDRGFGLSGMTGEYLSVHHLDEPGGQYALLDHARRSRLGFDPQQYRRTMAELLSPFSEVAAGNPHAAAPTARSAEELATITTRNRLVADPYPRFLMARDQVNQGAAVLLTSVGTAKKLGIPADRWVFLHGHADLVERPVLQRPDLGAAPAAVRAFQHALEIAEITLADLTTIDLYSCFPIAVSALCDGLGLDAHDPRGLTVTGGLPFFGGPGNNYSMHAIAETVELLRRKPGTFGVVGANGGILSKYSVGVYSTTPTRWREDDSFGAQQDLDSAPTAAVARHAHGPVEVESYTVLHSRGSTQGVIVGRLRDGQRILGSSLPGDTEMLALLGSGDPVGTVIATRAEGDINQVAIDAASLRRQIPVRRPALHAARKYVTTHQDGHLLEVTINRPEVRNALHPHANDELAEVFDAFFADPDLWVAIITGAGEHAFCAGNDLKVSAAGTRIRLPASGFGGLTHRAGMDKPVIAAVNGVAMGGGLEIVLACHLVVAEAHSRFALSEVTVGLVAGAGGLVRLPRCIPRSTAIEMILTGRTISAAQAHELGLVNRLVDQGQALASARELAKEILAVSPTSVRTSLRIIAESAALPDPLAAIDYPRAAIDDLLSSQDMVEGLTAFAEKRPAQWRNR